MLMQSCWSIVFNMLSGFDLNSKGSKNHLEMELEKIILKKKRLSFPSPFLLQFGLLAISFPAGLAWPAGPFSRRPAHLSPSPPPVFRPGPAHLSRQLPRVAQLGWQPLPPHPPPSLSR